MAPLSYHSSNLLLIALETMRLLVQIAKENILLEYTWNEPFIMDDLRKTAIHSSFY